MKKVFLLILLFICIAVLIYAAQSTSTNVEGNAYKKRPIENANRVGSDC